MHNYAPFDLRLFSHREGCYYFIGDPRDFGYTGQIYSYYGAHPVADVYGGGWCFMVGGHYHWWRPWSPYFTVVGPWYYWDGPYDPFFWSYWPYYSFYYRSYYPSYYAGGRYYRNGYRVGAAHHARSSDRVAWYAAAAERWRARRPGGGWRGSPPGDADIAVTLGQSGGRRMARRRPVVALRAHGAPSGGWRGGRAGAGRRLARRGAPPRRRLARRLRRRRRLARRRAERRRLARRLRRAAVAGTAAAVFRARRAVAAGTAAASAAVAASAARAARARAARQLFPCGKKLSS